ncbi:MAG: matrixin family metalloprotease [Deltaproteobacteria bacterium]
MRRLLAMALVGLCLGAPEVASAFECTRSDSRCIVSLHWPERNLPYVLRKPEASRFSEVDAMRAVDGAFERWASVACSDMRFTRVAILPPGPVNAVKNEVELIDQGWNLEFEPSAAAITSVSYAVRSGLIRTATISVNEEVTTTSSACSGAFDLQTVITHEVGHFIGLAHPCETPATIDPEDPCPVTMCSDLDPALTEDGRLPTMWPIVNACDTQLASLESDDTQALCFVYPRSRPPQQCSAIPESGESLVTNEPFGCTSTGAPSAWALIALLAWVRRRPRS